jgi:hypothetical protein
MKTIAAYLEKAIHFELLAEQVSDPNLKSEFAKQASAYRKLATERAKKLGLAPPEKPN